VTPPSLTLTGNGITVFLMGFDKSSISKIEKMFEKHVYDSDLSLYYSDESIDKDTIAWADASCKKANYIILNLDNTNPLEIELASENNFESIDENDDSEKVINYTNLGDENPLAFYKLSLGDNVIHTMDELSELIDVMFDNGE